MIDIGDIVISTSDNYTDLWLVTDVYSMGGIKKCEISKATHSGIKEIRCRTMASLVLANERWKPKFSVGDTVTPYVFLTQLCCNSLHTDTIVKMLSMCKKPYKVESVIPGFLNCVMYEIDGIYFKEEWIKKYEEE